jgi:hypothetical protein
MFQKKIHSIIREEIRTDSIIPAKKKENKNFGEIRRQLHLIFDKIKYNHRNIVDTTSSVVKRYLEKYFGQESSIIKSKKQNLN